ncbi:hypothetical protein [Paenibacillus sp. FSL M7-1046]
MFSIAALFMYLGAAILLKTYSGSGTGIVNHCEDIIVAVHPV